MLGSVPVVVAAVVFTHDGVGSSTTRFVALQTRSLAGGAGGVVIQILNVV